MLPRLKAQEALEQYEILAMAAPAPQSKEEARHRKTLHESLQRSAKALAGKPLLPHKEPITSEQKMANLQSMGFEVVQQ